MVAHCHRQWAHQFYCGMIGSYYVAFWHSKCLPICLTGMHQRSATKISSIDGDIVICCSSLLSTVSMTCWILTETSGIFYILTWWMGAYTYKEYIPKKAPQEYSILREILPFLAAHHHQQWADISKNRKPEVRYFHFWKPATLSISFFRNFTLKINPWISQWNQHQTASYSHI